MPRLPDGAGSGVLRPGRGSLAREPVTGVETPEPPVAVDPAVRVADDRRRPLHVTAGPDDPAVAAGVVDEGDAQRSPRPCRQVARVRLGERVAPEPPQEIERSTDVLLAGERQQHDVLAALEVGRVRSGARVDDRMAVDDLHPCVVPASAQVIALLVMGGGAEPGGTQRAVVEGLEDDEALLQVGLVIVGTLERGSPVVHRVEEHVVQDDPAALAHDPAVVHDARVPLPDPVVALGGRGRRAAGDATAQQQRRDEAGVHETGGQADPGEPARG